MITDDEPTLHERAPIVAGALDFLGLCLVTAAFLFLWLVLA